MSNLDHEKLKDMVAELVKIVKFKYAYLNFSVC